MTLAEIFQMLSNLTGFSNKVVYRAWAVGSAPALPFICYMETDSDNFNADNHAYIKRRFVDIELYSKNKDSVSESLIENALDANHLPFDKNETFIDSENCYQITYTIEA